MVASFVRETAILFLTFAVRGPHVVAATLRMASLKNFVINSTGLSLTGVRFHPENSPTPLWVKRIFGHEAVFWNMSPPHRVYDYNVTVESIPDAVQRFRQSQTQDLQDLSAYRCSFEAIGFVPVGYHPPFRGAVDRRLHPSTGTATLIEGTSNIIWQCYYRGLYSNYRVDDIQGQTFWTVVFYCPTSSVGNCLENATAGVEQNFSLIMQLHDGHRWEVDFQLSFQRNGLLQNDRHQLAICTAWPYLTSQHDKRAANAAILLEFIRYYSSLGIHMLVYDRNGENLKNLFKSHFAVPALLRDDPALRKYLHYHNYTLYNHLRPTSSASSDMSEQRHKRLGTSAAFRRTIKRMRQFDDDKELTYSHCRFEAEYIYGIQRVIVIDFDEFLFCTTNNSYQSEEGSLAPRNQLRETFDRALKALEDAGIEQVLIGKATIAKRHANSTILQCLQRVIANKAEPSSIFSCFSSVRNIIDVPNVKSIHLQRGCPFTGLHHACSPKKHHQHGYDCVCKSAALPQCYAIHVSLVEDKYYSSRRNTSYRAFFDINAEREMLQFTNAPLDATPTHRKF